MSISKSFNSLRLSAQDHSCTPDAFVHFEGATAVMCSPDVGRKYDRSVSFFLLLVIADIFIWFSQSLTGATFL